MKSAFAAIACLTCLGLWRDAEAKSPAPPDRISVQVALLLDTSNSMDGLIDQAKTQLWTIVNEFIRAKKDGKPPRMEVALYEYGKASLPSQEGYVRLILPLTDDLDRVSEELFALRTNGGDEYCGKVIQDAVEGLNWSRSRDVYKAIFIAGNEPFRQGPVDFRDACRAAIGRGILVNTIFCGAQAEGQQTGWKDGATLADGRFLSINHDRPAVPIPAPQDPELARLNARLNTTYIPYGTMGRTGLMRQATQDANALACSPGVLAARSTSKGSQNYCNSAWDLVDAIKTGTCRLDELKDQELPEGLRTLSPEQRKARVEELTRTREALQAQILRLGAEREEYLARERAKQEGQASETLDAAILAAIRGQATRLNFTFETRP